MAVKLTKKQRSVLDLLSSGFSNREAALKLKLNEKELQDVWDEVAAKFQTVTPSTIDEYEDSRTYDRVERHRLEAEIWASESRLSALMDTAPEAIFLIEGRSGRILKANNRALRLFGYTPRELLNQPVEMLLMPDVRTKHIGLRNGFLSSVRKREMGYHPPIVALAKDGHEVHLEIALTATASTEDVMVVCTEVAANPKSESDSIAMRSV